MPQVPEVPDAPSEGVLLRRARMARGLSLEEAARRLAKMSGAGFSASRWSQLESGYRIVGGEAIPQRALDGRLAQMAYVVGLAPEQLEDVDRAEAAQILRELLRQRDESGEDQQEPPTVPPSIAELTAYFRDSRVPLEVRQQRAIDLFRVLPYFMRGEEPPEITDDAGDAGRGSGRESA